MVMQSSVKAGFLFLIWFPLFIGRKTIIASIIPWTSMLSGSSILEAETRKQLMHTRTISETE